MAKSMKCVDLPMLILYQMAVWEEISYLFSKWSDYHWHCANSRDSTSARLLLSYKSRQYHGVALFDCYVTRCRCQLHMMCRCREQKCAVDITADTSLHAQFGSLQPTPLESLLKIGLETMFGDGDSAI